MNNWYNMEMKADGDAEIFIYGAIGPRYFDEAAVAAKQFATDFRALEKQKPKTIHVRINSPGGNVPDGTAIYNLLRASKHKVVTMIDGWAASMASVIALAGQEVRMAKNGLMMIHNPSTFAYGDSDTMMRAAALLDTVKQTLLGVYVDKTGREADEISAAMDKETWFSAEEAEAFGLIDSISDEQPVAAAADFNEWAQMFCHAPEIAAMAAQHKEACTMPEKEKVPASIAEIKAACPDATPEFILAQVEAEATEQEAMRAYIGVQAAERVAAVNALEAARAETAAAKKPELPGNIPLGTAPSKRGGGGSAKEEYEEKIFECMNSRNVPRNEAVKIVNKQFPELRIAYVEEVNAAAGRPCNVRGYAN